MTTTTTTNGGTMFTVATSSLPMSNKDTHSLCVRATVGGRPVLLRLYTFRTYDLALAAFFAVDDEERGRFAVRSITDPNVLALGNDPEQYLAWRTVANAVAAEQRKEEASAARWAIRRAMQTVENGGRPTGFFNVVADAMNSMRTRGYEPERWRVEQTVKDMVTIGRCHGHGDGRASYFFPRSTGARLAYTRCPECGDRLAQTTLALGSGRQSGGSFILIADPVATYFEKSLDALPGEKPEHVEARLDRLHEAIEAQA